MERIAGIICHKDYNTYIDKIEKYEKDRIFCKHNRKHFLDVCRISYLMYLENEEVQRKVPYSKDRVKEFLYAAGLLHDVGRWKEYEEGVSHEIAGATLAESILEDCGFTREEREVILQLILAHRKKEDTGVEDLSDIFSHADKKSRECFWCSAKQECHWKEERKNKFPIW